MALIDAQLQYYLHIQNPEDLDDDAWAEKFRLLEYIRKKEAKEPKKPRG